MAEIASRRAAHLIRAWAGGIGAGQADVRAPAEPARAVVFSLARVSALLGFPLGEDEARLALERLGFSCRVEGDVWRVTPPLHRADVRDTADVAEEVVRQIGYDRVPSRVRGAVPSAEPPSRARSLALSSRERFLEWGFWEASLSGLTPRALWKSLAGAEAEDPPELDNPLSLTGECLNPSLLVNLLSCLAGNVRRGNADARFFECARVFHREGATIKEEDHLAWVAAGRNHAVHWRWPARALEIWDAKAWAEEILKGWRLSSIEFRAGDVPFLHPAESQSIWMGERRLGAFGRLHPRRAEDWALPADTFLGEINLSAAARGGALPRVFSGLSRQPALLRDFSLVFPEHIAWARVLLWIHEQCEWVEGVELFDVFTGGDLPAGCRSLAFRVTFRHPDRTLTEAEAQGLQDRVLKGLSGAFQAAPRAAEPSK
jgi:phenylalanyl-tRNA synthetase beta chain